ncbi:MAG: acyloxyacyl hydrolase [Cyanobacteria bacterium J06627_8]
MHHSDHILSHHSLQAVSSNSHHIYSRLCGSVALTALTWAAIAPLSRASETSPAYYGPVNPSEIPQASEGGSSADDDTTVGRSLTPIAPPVFSSTSNRPESLETFNLDALTPEPMTAQVPSSQAQADDMPSSDNATPAASDDEVEPPLSFGDAGQNRWYVQGAGATTFENEFGLVGAGLSHFFANGQSINLELNGMAFFQTGDDAAGVNLTLLHRWHFVRQENWSLYIDGGAGLLGTTDDVPSTGSSFNFTPQAGGGATVRLNDEQRLMVGLRWHHISNANLFSSNPGRDSVMGYVGVNFPR